MELAAGGPPRTPPPTSAVSAQHSCEETARAVADDDPWTSFTTHQLGRMHHVTRSVAECQRQFTYALGKFVDDIRRPCGRDKAPHRGKKCSYSCIGVELMRRRLLVAPAVYEAAVQTVHFIKRLLAGAHHLRSGLAHVCGTNKS